jgi:hypothetical protein
MERKVIGAVIFFLILIPGSAFSAVPDKMRGVAEQYRLGNEAVMLDGPFYVAGEEYWIADYYRMGELHSNLVFSPSKELPVMDEEIMRKVLATRDLKLLTLADPLFYASGDSGKISAAARFETQNVRNFAAFSSITQDEVLLLEDFLKSYETTMDAIAQTSRLTSSILYPSAAVEFTYLYTEEVPTILIEIKDPEAEGVYSYEGFEELVASYDAVLQKYGQMTEDLENFAGLLEDYPPGATIREKWEVKLTKEGIQEEVRLSSQNGIELDDEIRVRRDILVYPYRDNIKKAKDRLGIPTEPEGGGICGPSLILSLAVLPLAGKRRGLRSVLVLLSLVVATTSVYPVLSQGSDYQVPFPDDLISKKVTDVSQVEIDIRVEGLNESQARQLLAGFPLLLQGEGVRVIGPYYYEGDPAYVFMITENGSPTGFGFMIDATTFRLIGDQKKAFRVGKTIYISKLIEEEPLYADVDVGEIKREADEARMALAVFLTNLSDLAESGQKLEDSLIAKPDFITMQELTRNYFQTYMMLQNVKKVLPEDEAARVTGGLLEKEARFEAYSRAMKGLSAEEYFQARQMQYRGRTLNRIPLMMSISAMGMNPSKAQVVHDLASDLFYDNLFLWRYEKVTDPNLFARLSFKEGTFSLPKSAGFVNPPEEHE